MALNSWTAMAQSAEHSAQARVRDSPGETPPCVLMRCNVLQVPNQIIPLGRTYTLRGELKLLWHVSGSFSGTSRKPSAIALCVALIRR